MLKKTFVLLVALTMAAPAFAGPKGPTIREFVKEKAAREQRTIEEVTKDVTSLLRRSELFTEKDLARISSGRALGPKKEAHIVRLLRSVDARKAPVAQGLEALRVDGLESANTAMKRMLVAPEFMRFGKANVAITWELPPHFKANADLKTGAQAALLKALELSKAEITNIVTELKAAEVSEYFLMATVKYETSRETLPVTDVYEVSVYTTLGTVIKTGIEVQENFRADSSFFQVKSAAVRSVEDAVPPAPVAKKPAKAPVIEKQAPAEPLANKQESYVFTIGRGKDGTQYNVRVVIDLPPSMFESRVLVEGAKGAAGTAATQYVQNLLKARGWENDTKATQAVLSSLLVVNTKYIFTIDRPRIDIYEVEIFSRDFGKGQYLVHVKADLDAGKVQLVKIESLAKNSNLAN